MAISEAKRRLTQYAAGLWARGAYSYALGGRRSGESWTYPPPGVPGVARRVELGETIDLNDGRDLDIFLTIGFGPDGFALRAWIEASYEVEGGYDGEELLVLPQARSRSAAELVRDLNRFVDELCSDANLLDRLGLQRK